MKHNLYRTGDADKPDQICDRNGEVVLACCRVCGLAEIELDQMPDCPGIRRGGAEIYFGPVQQPWVLHIPMMQQSVLFAAIRAPDGLRKNHPVKVLMRWFRRCILMSAFDKDALTDPFAPGGGSFTGPFELHHAVEFFGRTWNPANPMASRSTEWVFENKPWACIDRMREFYLEHVDEIPHHFQLHLMHAAQIVGVHHPDKFIRGWWAHFYAMLVNDAHLQPETPEAMNLRLSDNSAEWKAREVVTAK